jgi:ketosteroid isomerase-like protein
MIHSSSNARWSRRSFVSAANAAALAATVAAATPADPSVEELKTLMRRIMHAWDELDPAKAAPYYAKDPNLIFYDNSPLKYTGWKEYASGVPKEFAGYKSYKTTLADDIAAHRLGNFAWGIATWRADAIKKNGSTEVVYGRWTVLFEKRGEQWLIIHEHVSVPVG